MKIYINPSKQPNNSYKGQKTNEQEQMTLLAEAVKRKSSDYVDLEVVIATYDKTVTTLTDTVNGVRVPGRHAEAKRMGADLHLALHTNATGRGRLGAR